MHQKEKKPDVVHVDDTDTSTVVSFPCNLMTLPSASQEQACTSRYPTTREQTYVKQSKQEALQSTLLKEVETGSLISCPTCDGQFKSNEIEEHADQCAESTWHGSECLMYASLMSSFENNSDTDVQLGETHTQFESIEETGSAGEGTQEVSRGKLIGAIRELQKNMEMSTNRINVQTKTVLADYLNTRRRRPWFKPENRIKVVFIREAATNDGGPKRKFFTGTIHYVGAFVQYVYVVLFGVKLLKAFNFIFHFILGSF